MFNEEKLDLLPALQALTLHLQTHTDTITCIRFSRTDTHLASCTLNGELHVHNLLSGKTVAQFKLEDTVSNSQIILITYMYQGR